MDKSEQRQKHPKNQNSRLSEEKSVTMSEQEEDIICRMHKLVGDNWELIAGRIPGRKAEEIQRFWINKNRDRFKGKITDLN